MPRTPRFVGFLALIAALVIACHPRPAPIPAPANPAPAKPRGARVLVGTSGDYAPLSIAKGDRFEGFAPALVTAFASTHGMDVAWSRFKWTELGADMRSGRFEIAADGITVRPERSIAGSFTIPVARGGAVLLLRRPSWASPAKGAGGEIAGLDRKELRIAVNRGAHLERVTRALFHEADIRAIPDNVAVRDAFARGEVDAAMTNTFEAPKWAEGMSGIERIGPLTNDVTALWVRADRDKLALEIDQWLLDEEESGRLAKLRTKEIGEGAGPPAATVVSALGAAMAERLALMPFVADAKRKRGLAVEDTAQEAKVLASAKAQVESAARDAHRPAPSSTAIESFFRLQIEAAKSVQARSTTEASRAEYDLDKELRPAIARISARQTMLLVRVPQNLDARTVAATIRSDLNGLDDAAINGFSEAIVALGAR